MDFESDLGTLERIIMQFWPREATQDTSGLPIDDPLPTQKNGHKIFFDEKMVEMGLVEISTVPNRPFGARDDQNFFGPYQLGSKALVKCFQCRQNHFGAMKASHSRKSLKLGPKMVFCRNFCTPEFDLFGAGWSKIFRSPPKRSQSPQKNFWVTPNSFLGSVGLLEPKNRWF